RFGPWILDRPAPGSAETPRSRPEQWSEANARYAAARADAGQWQPSASRWRPGRGVLRAQVGKASLELEIAPLPSGQVGVFPEHATTWQWVADRVAAAGKVVRVLNLFAYTGGASLAAASAGAEVTHVDAAKSVVARARDNAARSGMGSHPIRWLVEDVVKYCQREVKRGNAYDAVIVDPPTFGRGPSGETWNIHRDLLPLLQLCRELTQGRLVFALVSCHTPGIGPAELSALLADGLFGHCQSPGRVAKLELRTADGRALESGTVVRWPG
ncbi:MAG: class I SAM-dependent methyltransferase, partial [Planctomycetales bacterium]|nr:class I SAM-dependent methyltransferase [Planctomycetales bacterium]